MILRLISAGGFRISRQIFLLFLILPFVYSCRSEKKETNDPQIARLQQDVQKLTEENRRLLEELQNIRKDLKQSSNPAPAVQQTQTAEETRITIEQMKQGVEPLLKDVVTNLKKAAETPRKDRQYGMRIDYDLKNAVYGLHHSGSVPMAKVIVKYEKFLESGSDSRSYGSGSSTFVFVYHNERWLLQSVD